MREAKNERRAHALLDSRSGGARNHAHQRTCRDGLCQQGRDCPAFAPGVVSGPHRARKHGFWHALWRWFVGSAP